MSLGTSGSSDGTDTVSQAVNRAADAGIIPVIAAGNSGPNKYTIGSPGAAEKAVTVAAMADVSEMGFSLASFSSRGPTKDERMKPEIAAPGVNISSAKAGSGNQYVVYSGTSMATPFVSGTVALMLDANPSLTLAQVRDILRTTAQDWGQPGQDPDYGWGRLDGYAAVKKAGNFTTGSAPTVPGHVTFTGNLAAQGGQAEHTFTVSDTSYPVVVTLIMPDWSGSSSPDFDLFVYNPDGSELGKSTDTNRQEVVAKQVTQSGTYKVVVKDYAGAGDYVVDVSAGLGSGGTPDRPPTVLVDQPAEGATVSGTTTVKVRAADDVRIAKVELAVDSGTYQDITGNFDGTTYNYSWNTAGAANGAHTLNVRATDSAGQTATAARHVTVSNQAPPPPPPGGVHELVKSGRVTAAAKDANVTFTVTAAGYVDLSLAWGTKADLDFYVYAPDGTYIGRAYTLNNPERVRVDTVKYGTGTYRVRVNLYSGPDTDFRLTADGYKQETYQGSVSSSAKDSNQTKDLAYTGAGRAVLSWPGSSDLDFYVYAPSGQERTRAYTLRNPEQADITFDTLGTWTVRVNLYAGAGVAYTLKLFVPDAVLGQ